MLTKLCTARDVMKLKIHIIHIIYHDSYMKKITILEMLIQGIFFNYFP